MNRTKIDTADFTWNPHTGCERDCWYCYANDQSTRFHKSFKPTFWPSRLDELDKLKVPTDKNNEHRKPWIAEAFPRNWLIFVCSVSDLFARWTKAEHRRRILERISRPRYSHLIFQLVTKDPQYVDGRSFQSNVWLGTTVTCQDDAWHIVYLRQRTYSIVRFVFLEPLLGPVELDFKGIDWIVIGKLTGRHRGKVKLQKEWVDSIIAQAGLGRMHRIPIFIKNSIIEELGNSYAIREWPKT